MIGPIWHHDGEDQKPIYHYKGCGLDDIFLVSGYEIDETPYGRGVRIKNLDDLHVQIGLFLSKNRKMLSGKEIRFLRHQMYLTQSELARLLGCNVQQVARYEKGQNKLTGPADRIIRVLFEEHVSERGCLRDILASLDSMDDAENVRIVFSNVDDEWRAAA